MSTEVNKAFVQQFSSNLIHLAQQKGSKLAGTVMRKDVTGKAAHFDRLGATAAQKRTSRHGDTPLIDTPHSRRKVTLDDYEWADLIDHQDTVRMLIDPRSDYALAGARALGRTLDDIIIDAMTGNSTSVAADDTTSNVAVAHTVDEDFNTANSDIIIEKVIEAARILQANEIDPETEKYFLVDSTSVSTLLQETEVQSLDTNSIRALVEGKPGTLLGFTFLHTERLNDSSESFKQSVAYVKDSMGLAMGKDINVRMSERDDKSYATQVYAAMTAGAVRIHEEGLVVVEAYRA